MGKSLGVLIVVSVTMLVFIATTIRLIPGVGVIVDAVILFSVIVPSLLVAGFIIYRRRQSKKASQVDTTSSSTVNVVPPVRSRSFSLMEMNTSTKNFSQKIGEGGFGGVYLGRLVDGRDVAVKVLSPSSTQGIVEFLNEIDLLSTVNHKNLVSLLGYCSDDSKELMLVYEYMSGESLSDHLYGSLADNCILDWKSRLRVALDAAEGLEYLHVSSTPKIIHRDVKSSNILLDSNLRAKLADFGLSKVVSDNDNIMALAISTHMTTSIKGTVGYLDPEYFDTSKLSERSDVYSFGVVLLEIICGRQSIDPDLREEEINLVEWVTLHSKDYRDRLTDVIDKRLSPSEDDIKSFYHVINLSIKCVESEGSKRPTMSEIVTLIKEAMIVMEPQISIVVTVEP